jgi:hypothetical protein
LILFKKKVIHKIKAVNETLNIPVILMTGYTVKQ